MLKIMKISYLVRTMRNIDLLKDNASNQLELWFWLIFWRTLLSTSVIAMQAMITKITKLLIYAIFGVPIVFYAFFKSVYDFGPANVRKRSFFEIIKNPVPPAFESNQNGKPKWRPASATSTTPRCYRPRPVPRKLCRSKKLNSKTILKQRKWRNLRAIVLQMDPPPTSHHCPASIVPSHAISHPMHHC